MTSKDEENNARNLRADSNLLAIGSDIARLVAATQTMWEEAKAI
jgi:hypothetical protein